MYLIQCVNAYAATVALAEREWDYKTAYALVTLKRKLQPHVDFYTGEELKLVEEYGERDSAGKVIINNGKFTFKDADGAQEYERRRRALGMLEVSEQFTPAVVPLPGSIKPVHLEALEGFIVFEEEGGGKE